MFIAGTRVDQLKPARESLSGTLVKLFLIWLFFCTSSTRDTSFIGICLIGLVEVFLDTVVVAAPVPVFFITAEESSILSVSSAVR